MSAETNEGAAPETITIAVRSSLGKGCRVYSVEAPANSTVADLKLMLCRPPHSACPDASMLTLVAKGKRFFAYV
jgi:hypothetical protein